VAPGSQVEDLAACGPRADPNRLIRRLVSRTLANGRMRSDMARQRSLMRIVSLCFVVLYGQNQVRSDPKSS
jgi:hypothetical protein